MQRGAESAADRLEALLGERDADRTRLAEVQLALQEAVQHLEDLSDDGQVLSHFPVPGCHLQLATRMRCPQLCPRLPEHDEPLAVPAPTLTTLAQ